MAKLFCVGPQREKFANRNRGLVTALLGIGVSLLVGIAGTTFGLNQANQKATLVEGKIREAEYEQGKAKASELKALAEKRKAASQERRAVEAEDPAETDAQRARDAEARLLFQLAVACYDAHRAAEARSLLHQMATFACIIASAGT